MALLPWLGLVTGREYDQKQWANINISALATSNQDQQEERYFYWLCHMNIQRLYICICCA